ncbi:hypothetical protein [Microbacterium flavum]|uniref:Uncharacterized protein n=1 Tax=Microbacterium flavum TaxID=415216 RepID=A0ABS5XQ24_9MICO|nr:hypothetical protein [Microbacterium flavum]MBT8796618.1 hypothetical protein [Microbacterium flavum]
MTRETAEPATPPTPAKRPAYEPATRLLRPTGYDPAMRRPGTTIAGVGLLALRVITGIFVIVEAILTHPSSLEVTVDGESFGTTLAVVVTAVVLLVDAALAFFIWLGWNWPRVVVMFGSVISVSSSFVAWWSSGQEFTVKAGLAAIAIDVLVLLALSSRSAAAYARRGEKPPPVRA